MIAERPLAGLWILVVVIGQLALSRDEPMPSSSPELREEEVREELKRWAPICTARAQARDEGAVIYTVHTGFCDPNYEILIPD